MMQERQVKLFRNGRNQAVRIPVEFEMQGDTAIMHREGNRLVIEPVKRRSLTEILATLPPLGEEFADINNDDLLPLRDIDL
ncbi:AbrB/MazE/SpoVT family DNA-binding domain-containing protein [Phyllobacterium sp. YR531]|uniref:antitoxin n=1 Tax=Phyllobacterium sp. YR531 TaxID=1144343 RepID=UPI00026F87C0|nr:AbrB/MazE/SpoVT family DNA-binding domain-containing protein [Phyllobacterium sp. YR531]EJM98443.1 virulence-associated protein [Phyllobacterium sp. YR531]